MSTSIERRNFINVRTVKESLDETVSKLRSDLNYNEQENRDISQALEILRDEGISSVAIDLLVRGRETVKRNHEDIELKLSPFEDELNEINPHFIDLKNNVESSLYYGVCKKKNASAAKPYYVQKEVNGVDIYNKAFADELDAAYVAKMIEDKYCKNHNVPEGKTEVLPEDYVPTEVAMYALFKFELSYKA